MANPTLAELLQPANVETVFNTEISLATNLGFPVSTWQPGGTERARFLLFATMLSNLSSQYIPTIVANGLLPLSTGDWLTLLALNNYNVQRELATNTDGYLSFDTTVSGAGPFTIAAQTMYAIMPDGLRYVNTTDFTIPADSYINLVPFVSEFPVNSALGYTYSEGNNQAIQLLNPLPGVVVTNPELSFSAVTHNGLGTGSTGIGTGTIIPSGIPVNKYFIIVRVDVTGEAGVASLSYSVDGSNYTSVGNVTSFEVFDGSNDTGVLVTLIDGSPTPSFVIGDTYTFSTPESWIYVAGADQESDQSLIQRCSAQWNNLSATPTTDFYTSLVKSVPTVGATVVGVITQVDAYVGNKVNIVCWGAQGELSAPTIQTIQEYVTPRVPGTQYPVVTSPGSLNVAYTFTITVAANQYNALYGTTGLDGLVGQALNAFTNTQPANSLIELASVITLIKSINGVLNFNITSLLINGIAQDLQLGSTNTFQLASFSNSTIITYVKK